MFNTGIWHLPLNRCDEIAWIKLEQIEFIQTKYSILRYSSIKID